MNDYELQESARWRLTEAYDEAVRASRRRAARKASRTETRHRWADRVRHLADRLDPLDPPRPRRPVRLPTQRSHRESPSAAYFP